jgi:hypothetical protein
MRTRKLEIHVDDTAFYQDSDGEPIMDLARGEAGCKET